MVNISHVLSTFLGLSRHYRADLAPSGPIWPLWGQPTGALRATLGPFGAHLPIGAVSLAITPLVTNGSNYFLRIVNLSHFWALRAPLGALRGSPQG